MKKLKVLWRILKTTGVDKIIIGYVVFILIMSFFIAIVEPTIANYGDSLWYVLISAMTIGYGDFVATTLLSRIMILMASFYGILVVALIPGILVSYFTEVTRIKKDETVMAFLDKLEHLPDLSQEELRQISDKVKKNKYKID